MIHRFSEAVDMCVFGVFAYKPRAVAQLMFADFSIATADDNYKSVGKKKFATVSGFTARLPSSRNCHTRAISHVREFFLRNIRHDGTYK